MASTDKTNPMKNTWLWWSSGKDSAWALHALQQDPGFNVTGLVTTVTPEFGRVAIHGTRLEVLDAQAKALQLPITRIELPYPCSNADYEAAVQPVLKAAEENGIQCMAFGDLFLEDVREYRENLFRDTELQPVFPIWGLDTRRLSRTMVDSGLVAYVTCLDPRKMEAEFAGARYDHDFLDQLSPRVDPCGENGEFHTCANAGPPFTNKLELEPGELVQREGFLYADFMLRNQLQEKVIKNHG